MWPDRISVDPKLSLELLKVDHSSELFSLINTNRKYLSKWLPWPDNTLGLEDTCDFVDVASKQLQIGNGVHYVIKSRHRIVGVAGFHHIDTQLRVGLLGFWLAERYQGRGMMTRACQSLTEEALQRQGLVRVEIRCAVDNVRSRAIPKRLHFRFVENRSDAEEVRGISMTHAVYAAEPLSWLPALRRREPGESWDLRPAGHG